MSFPSICDGCVGSVAVLFTVGSPTLMGKLRHDSAAIIHGGADRGNNSLETVGKGETTETQRHKGARSIAKAVLCVSSCLCAFVVAFQTVPRIAVFLMVLGSVLQRHGHDPAVDPRDLRSDQLLHPLHQRRHGDLAALAVAPQLHFHDAVLQPFGRPRSGEWGCPADPRR